MPAVQRTILAPDEHPRTGFFNSSLFHVLLLIIAALAVYSNTLQVPFQFDDPTNITDSPLVRNVRNFENWDVLMQSRSLSNLTLALNFRFNGTAVAGYHIVNILIHLVNALLVYALVGLLFRTPVLLRSSLKKHAGLIALFAALLFVTHPVQTGAVTYIVQRLASLATLFFLAGISAYLNSRFATEDRRSNMVQSFWYVVALVSAVLAMKSKETAFTLPIMICLAEFLFFTGGLRKRIAFLLPFLLTMLIIPFSLIGTGKPLGDLVGDVSKVTRLETNLPRT
ncbi:MAG: tetratricopeptide repeat protein, partial [Nitrospirota bacterium]